MNTKLKELKLKILNITDKNILRINKSEKRMEKADIYAVDKHFHNLPYMNLEKAEILRELFKKYDIKNCLEIGFLHGKSSAFIAAILNEMGRGHLTTIDLIGAKNKHPTIDEVLNELKLAKFVTAYFEQRSHTWRLMKLIEENPAPIFDFCYMDGGHTWDDTGFGFFLVDKLLKPGGWIVFDDLYYNYKDFVPEESKKEDWYKRFTEEETKTCQVNKVWSLLVKKHPNYDSFKEVGWWGFARKKPYPSFLFKK